MNFFHLQTFFMLTIFFYIFHFFLFFFQELIFFCQQKTAKYPVKSLLLFSLFHISSVSSSRLNYTERIVVPTLQIKLDTKRESASKTKKIPQLFATIQNQSNAENIAPRLRKCSDVKRDNQIIFGCYTIHPCSCHNLRRTRAISKTNY